MGQSGNTLSNVRIIFVEWLSSFFDWRFFMQRISLMFPLILNQMISIIAVLLVGSAAYADNSPVSGTANANHNLPIARTASGQVSGMALGQQGDVFAYKGIP